MGSDEYISVQCRVLSVSRDAALLQTCKGQGWCPRSVMHGASDLAVAKAGDAPMMIKAREWKLRALGLI